MSHHILRDLTLYGWIGMAATLVLFGHRMQIMDKSLRSWTNKTTFWVIVAWPLVLVRYVVIGFLGTGAEFLIGTAHSSSEQGLVGDQHPSDKRMLSIRHCEVCNLELAIWVDAATTAYYDTETDQFYCKYHWTVLQHDPDYLED